MYFYGVAKIQFMVILANKNIPAQALQQLSSYGELILLQTEKITYPAISGHPDIFNCPIDDILVVAPNLPAAYHSKLRMLNINFEVGYKPIGTKYPETAIYNCVIINDFLIGNTKFIDKKILELTSGKEIIHSNQGYTRCNLLPLEDNRFITSDKGIEKALVEKGLEVLYVNPEGIQLPGFENGFIGGAAGIFKNQIFLIGNLDYFLEGEKIRHFLSGYEIIELYDGPLFDAGSILFL
ncbi:MAG: hypothetical protein C0591_02410 [Marinilabiliales bacterium]|nr:MAG: hypothetical protein C0591_02410 [Marinilabiliales bacterium]